jgi:hypothetical protein
MQFLQHLIPVVLESKEMELKSMRKQQICLILLIAGAFAVLTSEQISLRSAKGSFHRLHSGINAAKKAKKEKEGDGPDEDDEKSEGSKPTGSEGSKSEGDKKIWFETPSLSSMEYRIRCSCCSGDIQKLKKKKKKKRRGLKHVISKNGAVSL